MIDLVLDAVIGAGVERPIVIVNPAHPEVAQHVAERAEVVYQADPKGTGDAVRRVPAERLKGHDVLVVNGDMPLIRDETIRQLLGRGELLTSTRSSRHDGRIIRSGGRFERIVEWKDASEAERKIEEINAGLYVFDGDRLLEALARLRPSPATGELYLTDVVAPGTEVVMLNPFEAHGVNSRLDLQVAEANVKVFTLNGLMERGVTIRDWGSIFVDFGVEIGEDTVIEPFTILRGNTKIGRGCVIGPYAHLTDTVVRDACRIEHSRLDRCSVGDGSDCGPFVRIRPGSEIAGHVHVGSFAEINRTRIGEGSAVPHFSYLGDAVIGRDVNIAAGTVTANYDGKAKHQTVIEDGVFLGVGTMLRAPVKLGKGSRTGAGAVVLEDVPAGDTVVGVPARSTRRAGERSR